MVTVTFLSLSLSSLRSPFVIIPLSQVNYSLGRVRIGTQLAHSFCLLPPHGEEGKHFGCVSCDLPATTKHLRSEKSVQSSKKNLPSPLFLTGPEGGRPPSSFAFRCCRIFPEGEGEAPGPFLLLTTARPRSGRARASPPAPPDGQGPGEGRWAPGAWMDAERWQAKRGRGGGDRRRERKRGGEKKGEVLAKGDSRFHTQ